MRQTTDIYAIPKDPWITSEKNTYFGKAGTVVIKDESLKVKVTAVPYIKVKNFLGPLIPVLPIPIPGQPPNDTILISVERENSYDLLCVEKFHIVSNGKILFPYEIYSQGNTEFKLFFDYQYFESKDFTLIILYSDNCSKHMPLEFKVDKDSKYKILSAEDMQNPDFEYDY